MTTSNQNEYLFSASLDRTVKVWNVESAICLCTIYTHLVVNQIYFNSKLNMLIAIANRLGNKKLLLFNLIHLDANDKNNNNTEANIDNETKKKPIKNISFSDDLRSQSIDIINFFSLS